MATNEIDRYLKKENIKTALETLPVAVMVTDPKGRVKFYNSAFVQLLGTEPEMDSEHWYGNLSLSSQDGSPITPDENPITVFLNSDDNSSESEVVVIANLTDGAVIWLNICSSGLYNEKGELIGTTNMLINNTGQKEVEQQLRKNKEELVDFFDNTAVGLHQTRSDGIIIRANQTILNLLGYSREEFVGSHVSDYYTDYQVLDDIATKLSAGEEVREYEICLRCKDGSLRYLMLNSNSHWKDGEFIHSQCVTRDITEQKRAQAAVKDITAKYNRQERLYEAVISSTPDLVYIFDLDYRFIFANDALLEMWGLNEEEYQGKGLREIGYEEWHAELHEREIDQVIATKEPVQGEVSFPHSSLGRRFYEYIFVPVFNNDNKVEAVAGTTRDVTRRKEMEEALRRNEEKYRTLIENFPNGAVGLFDRDFRYTALGGELVKSLGINTEDRVGSRITDIYPTELVDKIESYFYEAIGGKENSFEVEYQGRHLIVQTLPVKSEKGDINAGMIVVLDTTERWQAQQDLIRSEEKYRSLFKRMNEGFAVIRMEFDENREPVNFHFLETNPSYQRHSGLKNVEGKSAKEVIPDLGEDMLRRNARVALTGEPFHDEIYVKEIGRWLDLSSFRIGDPDEHKVAVLFSDITERKRAQKDLEVMNETLEERVKERTQSLLNYQDKLRSLAFQLSRTEEKQRQKLATELHDNLGQLLALGKMKINELQKGQSEIGNSPAVAELNKIMDDAIKYTRELTSELKPPPSVSNDLLASINWLAEKFAEHGLAVTIDDDNRPKVLDDELRTTVLQSIRELLFNVVKHTSEKKAVVRLERKNDQLQISVEDGGEGFDAREKELVSIQTGKFGLFNVYERLDLLGGRMNIESKKGHGTKITLYVPLLEDDSDNSKMQRADEIMKENMSGLKQEKQGDKIKVLLADDHKMFRNGLRKIIEEEEEFLVVGEAGNGEEAVTLSRETTPDVILMDVSMPRMDGIEATRYIKAEMPEIRIIGVSLHDSREIMQDMYDAGASAYLTKTEAFESLILTIRAETSATH